MTGNKNNPESADKPAEDPETSAGAREEPQPRNDADKTSSGGSDDTTRDAKTPPGLVPLEPNDQAIIVWASSLLVLIVIGIVGWTNRNLFDFPIHLAIADVAYLILSPLVLLPVGTALAKLVGKQDHNEHPSHREKAAQADKQKQWRYFFFLWISSIAQFAIITGLIAETGGVVNSPYAPILITFLTLALYVARGGDRKSRLRGTGSILILWTTGVILLTALTVVQRWVEPLKPERQVQQAVDELAVKCQTPTVLVEPAIPMLPYWWVNIITLSIGMLIAFGIKYFANLDMRESST
ncbi:hypothetical protein BJY24_007346 [Nocardia transvalensis]|uniref:Uncharacterized protein n=1 Tax=Nocardia transvalensis TaxID=37333 RepID=A0A7W9PMK2_9NOCA|nr:hypothetical protein [Nocardia transvalensis]MBB5918434.1 hypothetical protein [Nocardia transvalensis]